MSRRRRWQPWVRAIIIVLLLAGSGVALYRFRHGTRMEDLPLATARKGDFLVLVRCRGELTASRSVQLSAPLDVSDLQIVSLAPVGSEVQAGQIVIRFDPSKSQQDFKEKTAALNQAQASLDQAVAQARITAEQDKLDLEKAQYEMEKARLEASKQAIVSPIKGQESEIDLDSAKEKVTLQRSTIGLHAASDKAKIASQARLRDQARDEVALIREHLALMDVKTPIRGVISYLPNYTQGWMNAQPYKVGDHAYPGAVIAEVPDLSTLQMESKLDETDRGRVSKGDAVLVHVDALPEKVFNAHLTSISPLTEQSFNEWPPTRSFRGYALIVKPDARMRPGMNAAADIVEKKIANATSVPAKALFTRRGQPTVYVVSGDRYVPAGVKVQARNPDEVAVEGLAAGVRISLAEPAQESR